MKFYQDKISKIHEDVANLEASIDKLKQDAERALEKASEVSQPIKTKRSRKSIQSEIDKKKRHIELKLPQLAEREEIERQYLEAMGAYEKTDETIRGEEHALKVNLICWLFFTHHDVRMYPIARHCR